LGSPVLWVRLLIGHYFAAKARKSPYQEPLFSEQLSIVKRIHLQLGNIKDLVPLMVNEKYGDIGHVEKDAKEYIKILINLNKEATAILPAELWIDLNELVKELGDYYAKAVDGRSNEDIQRIANCTDLVTVVSRALLGIDEMTKETSRLITNIQPTI
jgi:hypothetical protein